ncbi:hypothetical protein RJ40_07705 [Methanofollis aquaemaris]|uniref:Uncharacterized protein n=1 Tax=Methanofollis aquaemaris TaxID=126734 RepID=A0A8A3S5I5_9EURY|nr:hypothetical protein [Methanofollis aquaemaris]QSZ67395.1 hypothetical protein RJ40_07705 [Methanofollis aquaemaris]
MKRIPIFSILLMITLGLTVIIPHFPFLLESAASALGIGFDQVLALFIVFMLLLAILLCVLFVLESVAILRAHFPSARSRPERQS